VDIHLLLRFAPSHHFVSVVESPCGIGFFQVSIMRELNHPNIVKLVEVIDDVDGDRLYLSMYRTNKRKKWSLLCYQNDGLEFCI
jgi:tRNA(Ser,Leu) C12 N-acetylase TAN1